ncbi:MAG: ABC transporter permease [Proteobacteria bacterium]|nr:ABC transporter permease [Pseudomonadota bacterium]MBU1452423.1 ABC transporter permease [Pseudomonadota bacterium]MBU2467690.1 ABC transporter permease [Pseudomonadota bacterium]MBU2518242.1 ABC transporter permease [Pseudomonadota bacterium]
MDFFLGGLTKGLGLLAQLDPEVYGIAWLSLRVSLSAVILAALAAVPLGLLIGQREFPGKRFLVVLFNTLLALPTVVVGLVVYGLLSYHGPLGGLGLLYTPGAMVAAQAVLAFPLITALVIAAVTTLDSRVGPTALTLGATRFQAAWAVLKEARFAVLAALAAGFGRVVTEVGAAIMVGGNIRHYTRTFTTAIALETSKGEFAQGMALGFILLVVALAVNLASHQLQARWK